MARITVVVPTVTTGATKLRVGITAAMPAVDAQVSFSRVSESHEAPVIGLSYVIPASEIDYILLSTAAYLDTTGRYRYETDVSVVTDTTSILLGKGVLDSVSTQDYLTAAFGKGLSDSPTAVDVLTTQNSFNRQFTETATAQENRASAVALFDPLYDNSVYVVSGYVYAGYVAADSAFTADSLGGYMQNYVSEDYFLEVYVGVIFGPY